MKRAAAALVVLLVLTAGGVHAAGRYLPRLTFRVLATPHFRIYYHPGIEREARQLAAIVERERTALAERLGLPAPGLTHVVLADQDDTANGSAIPLPYNTITINAAWPRSAESIGYTSDWLRLVFIHEYTHILQMDQSRGWSNLVRKLFGRTPLAFPNLFLPQWQVEGLATYAESAMTGEGRVYGGDSRSVVLDRIVLVGAERMDRLNGGHVSWPTDRGPYLYGALFHEFLAKQKGDASLGELSRRTAGRVPYFTAGAFKAIYGESPSRLWEQFQKAAGDARGIASGGTPARRLTWERFVVTGPRFVEAGQSVLYTVRNPDEFPSLALLRPGSEPRRIATRFGGETVTVAGDLVVFDQFELEQNVALRSDLYAMTLPSGRTRRLTREGRYTEAALAPDGRRLVAICLANGGRQLVRFDLSRSGDSFALTPPLPFAASLPGLFANPRWSPDGRRIVAERRVPGGPSELVVLTEDLGELSVVASTTRGRMTTPAWLPGGETILFAWDRNGDPFQVYAVEHGGGPVRRVTSLRGGAMYPEPSADGRRLAVTSYTGEGYDVFEVALDPAAWAAVPLDSRATPLEGAVTAPSPVSAIDDRAYSPLETVLPRTWTPLFDTSDEIVRVGAAISGVDILGRHLWGVSSLWRTHSVNDDVSVPDRGRPDWSAYYVYDRWRPAFVAAASAETTTVRTRTRSGERGPDLVLRETDLEFGVAVPWRLARQSHIVNVAFSLEQVNHDLAGRTWSVSRNAIRSAWSYSNARRFARGISSDRGVTFGVTSEQVRANLGASGNADAWTVDLRGFVPALPRHGVVALRLAAGTSRGSASVRRQFLLGGTDPAPSVTSFNSDALSLVRGLHDAEDAGRHVAVASVEYRVPLWRIERGRGLLPVFLRTIHGAVFADAGEAWNGRLPWSSLKVGTGAELSADVVIGYGLPVTVTGGVAWARNGETAQRFGPIVYMRVGRSF